jgi:hypothetical protein
MCVSSIVAPIHRTVSDIATLQPSRKWDGWSKGVTMLSSRPGSIKKGNRKSEILLRDAEVGILRF